MKIKRVVLTGGHASSTAFEVVEEIRRQKKDWKIYWIGVKSAIEGKRIPTLASVYFPSRGVKTLNIITGRVQRKFSLYTIPSVLKIPFGFIHALILLFKIKPNLILSFGGFAAYPVVVAGYLFRVPVIIHEQTSAVGRSNKLSSFFASKIAISREESRKYFPGIKTVLTGNPTPKKLFRSPSNVSLPHSPSILITGGQSGSLAINNCIEKTLPDLLEKFKVVHLTGARDEQKFRKIKEQLDNKLKPRYSVFGIVEPSIYNTLFSNSDIVISRAGANTVSKIVASKKPSILIPLPISYLNEQSINAQFAEKLGIARVIKQDLLKAEYLQSELEYIKSNYRKMLSESKKYKNRDFGASERLVGLMSKYI